MKRPLPILAAGLFLACTALFLAAALSLMLSYDEILAQTRQQEVYTAQGLAGALLTDHPEMEAEIAAHLQPDSLARYQPKGAAVLSRYGFGNSPLAEDTGYLSLLQSWRGHLLLILAAGLLAVAALGFLLTFIQKKRQEKLLIVLEEYLCEDYRFAASQDLLYGKDFRGTGGRLSDLLKQLGNATRLKNQLLIDERQNTQALVTDISHQLKTPIASLQTCLTMTEEAETVEEREEFLTRSLQQAEKMQLMTKTLLSISRIETAKIELHPQATDLQEMLIRAAGSVYDKARQKDIALELLPSPPTTLNIDERWTAEALMNVLDNAVKYSPSGSRIVLAVEILLSFIRITVTDEGVGIAREEQARIFQRFYRGSDPLVATLEGSGVGLYLSRTILERQGGGISVKSTPGQGSTFTIYLPKPTPEAEANL